MLLVISVDDTIFLFFLCAFFLPERIETSTVGPEISLGLSCGTQESVRPSPVLFPSTLPSILSIFKSGHEGR